MRDACLDSLRSDSSLAFITAAGTMSGGARISRW